MKLIFDIETNELDFSNGNFLDNVRTILCMVVLDYDTGTLEHFYNTDGLRELGTGTIRQGIKKLEAAHALIGHNIIQFDLPVLRKLYGFEPKCRTFDTLVASRTLYPDRPGGHSLRAWGERLGINKGDHSDFGKFSQELLDYCEQDVLVNRRIYECVQQESKQGNWKKPIELEHKIAEIIARQEAYGFHFNKELAEKYITDWETEINDIDKFVLDWINKRVSHGVSVAVPFKINGDLAKRTITVAERAGIAVGDIAGPFQLFEYEYPNIESKIQQKEILLELGWQPEQLTKTGTPRIDDSIEQVGPVGEKLNRRNVISHRRSQVAGLLALVDQNGRIHGGANPCGTNTSRMKHMRIVNIPRATSPYGKEIRGLFDACSGQILVGYDAAALELRILAHYIGNEDYNVRITTKDKSQDAHTLAAKAANSDDRELGKTINYALIYGAGDTKLGSIIGGTTEDGRRLRVRLYNEIPGLGKLVERAKSAAKRGYIVTLDGRKLYLRPRVSPLNTLIQGGGSIFMKTVAASLDELAKYLRANKVIDMHDEAQWECHPNDVRALTSCIHEAFARACQDLKLRCPQEAEVKTGMNWSETH